jgi:hypothetical protein
MNQVQMAYWRGYNAAKDKFQNAELYVVPAYFNIKAKDKDEAINLVTKHISKLPKNKDIEVNQITEASPIE